MNAKRNDLERRHQIARFDPLQVGQCGECQGFASAVKLRHSVGIDNREPRFFGQRINPARSGVTDRQGRAKDIGLQLLRCRVFGHILGFELVDLNPLITQSLGLCFGKHRAFAQSSAIENDSLSQLPTSRCLSVLRRKLHRSASLLTDKLVDCGAAVKSPFAQHAAHRAVDAGFQRTEVFVDFLR